MRIFMETSARALGLLAPDANQASKKEAAPSGSGLEAEKQITDTRDSEPSSLAQQALLMIEGGSYAAALLERIANETAHPSELCELVEFLRQGPMLAGFCRAIQRKLEGRA
jgi:hypothetical protein